MNLNLIKVRDKIFEDAGMEKAPLITLSYNFLHSRGKFKTSSIVYTTYNGKYFVIF